MFEFKPQLLLLSNLNIRDSIFRPVLCLSRNQNAAIELIILYLNQTLLLR